MRRLADGRVKTLAVVSRERGRELIGTVGLEDVLDAYKRGAVEPAIAEPVAGHSRLLAGMSAALISVC